MAKCRKVSQPDRPVRASTIDNLVDGSSHQNDAGHGRIALLARLNDPLANGCDNRYKNSPVTLAAIWKSVVTAWLHAVMG